MASAQGSAPRKLLAHQEPESGQQERSGRPSLKSGQSGVCVCVCVSGRNMLNHMPSSPPLSPSPPILSPGILGGHKKHIKALTPPTPADVLAEHNDTSGEMSVDIEHSDSGIAVAVDFSQSQKAVRTCRLLSPSPHSPRLPGILRSWPQRTEPQWCRPKHSCGPTGFRATFRDSRAAG